MAGSATINAGRLAARQRFELGGSIGETARAEQDFGHAAKSERVHRMQIQSGFGQAYGAEPTWSRVR